MQCTTCQTDNPATAATCSSCGTALTSPSQPKPRRRKRNDDETDSPRTLEYNRQVVRIFRLCLVSMIPFLGLLLGPLGALLGLRLLRQAKGDPAFTAARAAQVAVLLGTATAVTNWLGVGLMTLGLVLGW